VSTGDLSLDQLAEQAEQRGLDAVVLTDNFVLRYEYGLYPFRGLIHRTFSLPSVLEYGVGRFLTDVAAAQARHPRILLVPGLEVVPHYFWTGSLFEQNLTMHNSQKNILVVGLSRAEDYASLPVNGNPGSYRYGWSSLLNLTPAILLVPAALLWRRRTYQTATVGRNQYRVPGRQRTSALILAATSIFLLAVAWPPGEPVFSSYDDRLGYQPYQAFIDAVKKRGGMTIWSMPEARDFNVYPFGRMGSATVKTDPYPEALVLTSGYTGFGGIYQDTRTVTKPGDIWDRLLGFYLTGQLPAPPFTIGEIAFHGLNRDTRELDQVLTVFQVRERSEAGILEALRTGRHYAVGQYRQGFGLRLDEFRVESNGGARRAESGELLNPGGARDIAVRLSISAVDRGAHPIVVSLVRSGIEVARLEGTTPFTQQFADVSAPPGVWHFYRIAVDSGADGELLSNPIFVAPIPAEATSPQPPDSRAQP
jgi:hypothetical protein